MANAKHKKERLQAELRVKQENFIKKERVYKTKIDAMETELGQLRAHKTSWMEDDAQMVNLKKMHQEIQRNVGIVQHRTAKLVQEQESDLLRAFRARLADVQLELEKEKSKTDDGAMAWIDRSRTLEGQVDAEKDRADKLDRVNQTKGRENARLKQQFQMMEDDREYLVKQLVAHKKQNERLRKDLVDHDSQLQALRAELGSDALTNVSWNPGSSTVSGGQNSKSGGGLGGSGGSGGLVGGVRDLKKDGKRLLPRQQAETRYTDIVNRLTKMLEMERRHRVQVQAALDEHKASVTGLEEKLKTCVEEVCAHRGYANAGVAGGIDVASLEHHVADNGGAPLAVDALNGVGRERALELWLSMEGVIEDLCE
jgi:DNA repair exonuclease SbcCD ATPase subunit